jgi:hypothetical protein
MRRRRGERPAWGAAATAHALLGALAVCACACACRPAPAPAEPRARVIDVATAEPRAASDLDRAAPRDAPPTEAATDAGSDPEAQVEEVRRSIRAIAPTERAITRRGFDLLLANSAELLRSARLVPEQAAGKVVGMRLYGVRRAPSSRFSASRTETASTGSSASR